MNPTSITSRKIVTANSTIKITRELPAPGLILPRIGQQVKATDVVGRCDQPRHIILLDIASALGIDPGQTRPCLLHRPGANVQRNEPLAEYHRGLRRALRVFSPVDGRILAFRRGRMLIEPLPEVFEIEAGMSGEVVAMDVGRSVTIAAPGAKIEGVWSAGGLGFGAIKLAVSYPDTSPSFLPASVEWRNSVIVCGAQVSIEFAQNAVRLGARGLIMGSINADQIDSFSKLGIPIVITEGFGSLSMSNPVFDILRSCSDRTASLFTVKFGDRNIRRPSICIPDPSAFLVPGISEKLPSFSEGSRVRVINSARWGKVQSISSAPVTLETGISAPGANIELDDGTIEFIPFQNLEIIE
ncbi:MAG: hypothetical protein ABFQ89_00535 [Chloroflexota bacterium]